jgi:hypothetical protein
MLYIYGIYWNGTDCNDFGVCENRPQNPQIAFLRGGGGMGGEGLNFTLDTAPLHSPIYFACKVLTLSDTVPSCKTENMTLLLFKY